MPTYEYRCPDGHEFEVFQRMSDEPVASCPECGKPSSRLLSGGGGLLFKGEGFYITDYRSADYRKKAEAEAGGSADKGSDGSKGGASDTAAGSSDGASGSSGAATPARGASEGGSS